MNTFPWFCGCRVVTSGTGEADKGMDEVSGAGVRRRPVRLPPIEGSRYPGSGWSIGFEREAVPLTTVAGELEVPVRGAEVGAAAVRTVSVTAYARAGTFPGSVAPAHFVHFSRSDSVRDSTWGEGSPEQVGSYCSGPRRTGILGGPCPQGRPCAQQLGFEGFGSALHVSFLVSFVFWLVALAGTRSSQTLVSLPWPLSLWLSWAVPGTTSGPLRYRTHLIPPPFLPVEEGKRKGKKISNNNKKPNPKSDSWDRSLLIPKSFPQIWPLLLLQTWTHSSEYLNAFASRQTFNGLIGFSLHPPLFYLHPHVRAFRLENRYLWWPMNEKVVSGHSAGLLLIEFLLLKLSLAYIFVSYWLFSHRESIATL